MKTTRLAVMLTQSVAESPVCQPSPSSEADHDAEPAKATASTAQNTPSGRSAGRSAWRRWTRAAGTSAASAAML